MGINGLYPAFVADNILAEDLNSELSFFKTGCPINAKEFSLSYYFSHSQKEKRWIPTFSKVNSEKWMQQYCLEIQFFVNIISLKHFIFDNFLFKYLFLIIIYFNLSLSFIRPDYMIMYSLWLKISYTCRWLQSICVCNVFLTLCWGHI